MLGDFDYCISDPNASILEVESIAARLERYGLVSEHDVNAIHDVMAVLYKKEIKLAAKAKFPDTKVVFAQDFYVSDLIDFVADKRQLVVDYRNAIRIVVNSGKLLTDKADLATAVAEVKRARQR